MATIKDIARLAEVSESTVSRVLNGTAVVDNEKRKKIERVIQELNYYPSPFAQGMRLNKTRIVGIVIPDYSNAYYSHMVGKIESELEKHNYMAIICSTSSKPDEEKKYIQKLMQRRIDGILFFTYNCDNALNKYISNISKRIPFILMEDSPDDQTLSISQVHTNGYGGIKKSTQYFIDNGHRKIACLASAKRIDSKRLQGYIDTLKENDIPFDEKYVFKSDYSLQSGAEAGKYFSELENRPTAIVCVSDYTCVGMIRYFRSIGISVPDDIETISYDDIELASLMEPQLSTVAHNFVDIARDGVKILLDMIHNNAHQRNKIQKVVIEGKLILRQTTK